MAPNIASMTRCDTSAAQPDTPDRSADAIEVVSEEPPAEPVGTEEVAGVEEEATEDTIDQDLPQEAETADEAEDPMELTEGPPEAPALPDAPEVPAEPFMPDEPEPITAAPGPGSAPMWQQFATAVAVEVSITC